MTIEVEGEAPDGMVDGLRKLNNVINAMVLKKIS